jgi:hypothetical protein
MFEEKREALMAIEAAVEFVRNYRHFWNSADWVTREFALDLLKAAGFRLPDERDAHRESGSKEQ